MRTTLCTLTIAGVLACSREGAGVSRAAGTIAAALDTSGSARNASIVVSGFSSEELRSARALQGDSAFQTVVRITVGSNNETPMLGKYVVSDSAIQFVPQFPLNAGRDYHVRVNAHTLSATRADSTTQFVVALPAGNQQPHTRVTRILPGSPVLPENLLRLYIEFSAPMSRSGGLEFMKLMNEAGQEVPRAFLPLESDFWNDDRTRYTAFLDPGRVKRGILPNEQLGRAILAGHSYSIVIDSAWRDNDGLPLVNTFRHSFRVSAPDDSRIDYTKWKLSAPKPGTRDTLVVTFEKPLDHGLLKRALGVQAKNGTQVSGTVDIQRNEREWRFVPSQPWSRGDHNLVIFSILEDAAGNRVDGPFEVDMFNEVDKGGKPEQYLVRFTVFSQ